MPRNKYPEETVQKILDVSLKLFLEKGYDQTTVLDIVHHLGGLTRGAFYHHFKSKEEVLNALGDKLFFESNPFELVKNDKSLTGLEKIKKVLKSQFQNQEYHEVNLMSVTLMNDPKMLAMHIENSHNLVAPLFEELFLEAIADGSIKNVKYPRSLARLFILISDIWCIPSIFPCSEDDLLEKLYLAKEIFDMMGAPIIDEEILSNAKGLLTVIQKK